VEEGLDVADDDLDESEFEADNEETDEEAEEIDADAAVDDDDEAVTEEEADEAEEEEPAVAARSEKKTPETVLVHSPAAKEATRQRLASDVEAFLKRGGSIESVPQDVRADPPKKPESNYGRGSI
jgi:hypothetical protein